MKTAVKDVMTTRVVWVRQDASFKELARGVTAADLMTSPAVTAAPGDTTKDAARLMYTRKVKRLPVTDPHGNLLGMVSRTDVLLNNFLVDPDEFRVAVKDGIVTITGTPETDVVGREIVRQARHVQGVVAVRDRLRYAEGAAR